MRRENILTNQSHVFVYSDILVSILMMVFISVRCLSEDELLLLSPEELCKDRLSEEYFRLKADYDGGDCRDVVRYAPANSEFLYFLKYLGQGCLSKF